MKRTLSLTVAVLLVLALIPFGGIVKASIAVFDKTASAEPAPVRTGMSERELRWAALDEESLAAAEADADAFRMQVTESRDPEGPINYEEAQRLFPFFFDYINDPITNEAFGLCYNIDRLWGVSGLSEDPDYMFDPYAWYSMDEEGNCTAIAAWPGYLAGIGSFEADYLDVNYFQSLNHIKLYPHYISTVYAQGCPSLDWFTFSSYDDYWWFFNYDYYYGLGDWNPEHHSVYVDLSDCPALRLVQIYKDGLEQINLDGSLGDNMQELYLAFNQIEGEVPDLSNAHNLRGFAIPENHFTGELVIDSADASEIFTEALINEYKDPECPWTVCFDPRNSNEYGGNYNSLTDINILNSRLGALHFGTENAYVDVSMSCWPADDHPFVFLRAYPMYEGYEFVGWFDPDGEFVSGDQDLILYRDGDVYDPVELEHTDLTAVFAEPEPQPLSGVHVEPAAYLTVGESCTLHAAPVPISAVDYEFAWAITSGNELITLEADGDTATVTALAQGNATVTLTGIYHDPVGGSDQTFTADCEITIGSPSQTIPILAIELDITEATMQVGDVIDLHATVYPGNADIDSWGWGTWCYGDPHVVDYAIDPLNRYHCIVTAHVPGRAEVVFSADYFDPEQNTYITIRAECVIQVTDGIDHPTGDVDMDGTVTVSDALLAMRKAMGIINLTSQQVELADFDGDGAVDIADALMIMRRAMGLI